MTQPHRDPCRQWHDDAGNYDSSRLGAALLASATAPPLPSADQLLHDALCCLYHRHAKRISGFLRGHHHLPHHDADEVLGEVFVTLARRLRALRDPGALDAFVWGIVRMCHLAHKRRGALSVKREQSVEPDPQGAPDKTGMLSDRAVSDPTNDELEVAFELLWSSHPHYAELLERYAMCGDYEEIYHDDAFWQRVSPRLSKPKGPQEIRRQLARAREHLRRHMRSLELGEPRG